MSRLVSVFKTHEFRFRAVAGAPFVRVFFFLDDHNVGSEGTGFFAKNIENVGFVTSNGKAFVIRTDAANNGYTVASKHRIALDGDVTAPQVCRALVIGHFVARSFNAAGAS